MVKYNSNIRSFLAPRKYVAINNYDFILRIICIVIFKRFDKMVFKWNCLIDAIVITKLKLLEYIAFMKVFLTVKYTGIILRNIQKFLSAEFLKNYFLKISKLLHISYKNQIITLYPKFWLNNKLERDYLVIKV